MRRSILVDTSICRNDNALIQTLLTTHKRKDIDLQIKYAVKSINDGIGYFPCTLIVKIPNYHCKTFVSLCETIPDFERNDIGYTGQPIRLYNNELN